VNIVHLEDEPWDSGIAHYALTLAAEQARRGHRVAFWGLRGSPVLEQAAALGLATRGWDQPWLELRALRRELAAFAPRVVNAHTGSCHALALVLAPRGAAVVRTRGDARAPKGGLLARFAAKRTAAFIAANSALKSQLEAALPGARVRMVAQGLAGPAAPAPLPAAPIVGVLARFDPVKGHEVVLEAAALLRKQVPGLRFVCAGEGPQRERLAWQLKPMGLDALVSFPGRAADKWAFLAGCRLGLVPSLGSEAVSRAALEWMAAGRPVIASRVGGLPDLVEDGITGLLVPPGDAATLAEAVRSLLADAPRLQDYAAAGRERWQRLFSPGPFYEDTEAVYEETTRLPR
jgi:glycosyltransferase involved in cell wall biosynthesis